MVYIQAPWGEVIEVYFSPDQWEMVHQVSLMANEPVEEVVCQIIASRFESEEEED